MDNREWVTDDELAGLMTEQMVEDTGHEQQAMSILRRNSPAAAMSIVKLALYADSAGVRLNASKYILDRTLTGETGSDQAPWESVYERVLQDIEAYANRSK